MPQHIKLFTPLRSPEEVAKRAEEIRARAPIPGGHIFITTEEAAELAGLSTKIVADIRYAGGGPPYYHLPNLVLYELDDILNFIERRRIAMEAIRRRYDKTR